MICDPCKTLRRPVDHAANCRGGTWCDCQHLPPASNSAAWPINQLGSAIMKTPVPEISMTPDPWAALAHAARQRDVQLQADINRLRPQALRVYDDEYGDRMAAEPIDNYGPIRHVSEG
jgi:hypothetical protein